MKTSVYLFCVILLNFSDCYPKNFIFSDSLVEKSIYQLKNNKSLNLDDLIRYSDTVLLNKLIDYSQGFLYRSPDEAKIVARKAEKLAVSFKFPEKEFRAKLLNGYACFFTGDFKQSDSIFNSCLELSEKVKNNYLKVEALNAIAWNFNLDQNKRETIAKESFNLASLIKYEKGKLQPLITLISINIAKDNSEAMKQALKALKLLETNPDDFLKTQVYTGIAAIYFFNKSYDKSLHYAYKALNIAIQSDNSYTKIEIINILGEITNVQNKNNEALYYYTHSLNLAKKIRARHYEALLYNNRAEIYKRLKMYKEALSDLKTSLKINKMIFGSDYEYMRIYNIGDIYFKLGNYGEAIIYLEEAKNNCLKSLNTEHNTLSYITQIFEILIKCYEKTNNTKKANSALWELLSIKDNIFNINKIKITSELAEKYQFEQKEKENKILSQNIAINDLKLSRSRIITYILIIGIIILILIGSFILFERRKTELLLLNILPKSIARRLRKKEMTIADKISDASVVFIDIVDFTKLSSGAEPHTIVIMLNTIFTEFDKLTEKYEMEKIKTIGDCYMAGAGIPEQSPQHSINAARFALEALDRISALFVFDNQKIETRIGIDCGPVVAGVIGKKKFNYDIWGDTVNTASRMESYSKTGKIQVTDRFKNSIESFCSKNSLESEFHFTFRGSIDIKGKGQMDTWFMNKKY